MIRPFRVGWTVAAAALSVAGLAVGAAPAPMTLADVARLESVTVARLSPEGSHCAYVLSVPRRPLEDDDGAARSELHVLGPDGRSRPFVTGDVEVSQPAWRPGRREVSFLAKREGDEHTALWIIPIDGGEAYRALDHATDVGGYSWAPDGQRVAFLAEEAPQESAEELKEKGFDQKVFEEDLRPVRVWIGEARDPARRVWSEVGTRGKDEDAAPGARLLSLEGSASELRWSPQGDLLALALAPTPLVDDHYMERRVHLVRPDSGEMAGEVATPGKLGRLEWSPDGSWLALVAAADRHDPREGRLLVVPAAGGEPVEVTAGFEGHVMDFGWRDAETLVYVGAEGVWTSLRSVRRDGSQAAVLAAGDGQPIWRGISLSAAGERWALTGDSPLHPEELFVWSPEDGGAPARASHHNPWLEQRRLAPQDVVRFAARDGLEIEGLLIRPPAPAKGKAGPRPLVVVVHGGPEAHYSNGWLTRYSTPGQVLASRGFLVFYPNYRGSTGRGVAFSKLGQGDPAGKEFDDLVDGVDHLVEAGVADDAKVGITGGSYGGFATAWAATRFSERFAAGVGLVGITDEISMVGTSDIPNELHEVHLLHWPFDDWQGALERSPVHHVREARTPLLLLHGEEDPRVFRGQSLELYRFLKVLGQAPVRLVLYPGEGHGNRRAASRFDASIRLVRWFEHYLLGAGGEPPPYALDYGEWLPETP